MIILALKELGIKLGRWVQIEVIITEHELWQGLWKYRGGDMRGGFLEKETF